MAATTLVGPLRGLRLSVLAIVATLPILLLAPSYAEPVNVDEAAYAVVARGLLDGQVPYRDLFDHKPPLIYAWYASGFAVLGDHLESPRIMLSLVWGATGVLVALAGRNLLYPRAGEAAGLAFALSSGMVLLNASANTEGFMLLPMTGALVAASHTLVRGHPPRRWLLLAGFLGGLAVLTKQIALVPTAVIGLAIVSAHGRRVGPIASYVGGGFIAFGLVLLPFVLTGAADDFYYANFTYNALYAGIFRLPMTVAFVLFFLLATAPLTWAAWVGLRALAPRWRSRRVGLLLAWSAGCAGATVIVGRTAEHYWVALLPPLALLAGFAVASGQLNLRTTGRRRDVALGLAVVVSAVSIGANLVAYLAPNEADRHLVRMQQVEDIQARVVARRVAELTAPGEPVAEIGRNSQIAYFADRPPASRFFYDRPFWLDPAALDEAVADLHRTMPRVLLATMTEDPGPPGAAVTFNGRYMPREIAEFIEERYDFVERVEFADIYRLRTPVIAANLAR